MWIPFHARQMIDSPVVLTLAAVSRAFRSLTTRGVIKVRDRRHVRIIDRTAFENIAGDPPEPLPVGLSDRPE